MPVTLPQKNLYTLNPGSINLSQTKHSNKTLLVMNTDSNDELQTNKIAYVIHNKIYCIVFFDAVCWTLLDFIPSIQIARGKNEFCVI